MLEFERDKFTRATQQSGLSKSELAAILEISRQQVYNLMAGANPRGGAATRRANIYVSAICKLIDQHVLPLPGGIVGPRRVQALAKLKTKLYDLARP